MKTPAERFRQEIPRWFAPGGAYTFVGAGGKSTAMKHVARYLAGGGLKVRMTTTTRVGIDEFAGFSVRQVQAASDVSSVLGEEDPVLLLVGGVIGEKGKYAGIDPRLIDALRLPSDTVLLVEGDGSRGLPMKAPREWEPVIPSSSRAVLALMGASAFGRPVDKLHCYNHEKVLALLGRTTAVFQAEEITVIASDGEGCRKGVLPGMAFRLLINQCDLDGPRETGREALVLMRERRGIDGALVSFQKEELYGTTED